MEWSRISDDTILLKRLSGSLVLLMKMRLRWLTRARRRSHALGQTKARIGLNRKVDEVQYQTLPIVFF